ncbi:MAG: stage III sporulation protein AF [Clostridia bacterium]|nr:stage III sporulation protein AF [Clostridia bacterium]
MFYLQLFLQFFGKKDINLKKFDYEDYFQNTQTYQAMSDSLISYNDESMEEIYQTNLKQDMKQKLKQKGYLAKSIIIDLELKQGDNYGRINKIDLKLSKIKEDTKQEETKSINIDAIEDISIGNTIENDQKQQQEGILAISSSEQKKIKEYLSEVYDVKTKHIQINENT